LPHILGALSLISIVVILIIVKLRLCPECSVKLNYKKAKMAKLEKKEEKLKRKMEASGELSSEKKLRIEYVEADESEDGTAELVTKEETSLKLVIGKEAFEEERVLYEQGKSMIYIESSRYHWTKPIQLQEGPKSKEEEMDDFLADLFQ
jgi:protein FRA10AC1